MSFALGSIHQLLPRRCKEQAQLVGEVDRFMAEHAAAAGQLAKGMAAVDINAFHIARLSVEAAHARMTQAMNALKKHRKEHGC